jgi:hypothetical protein
MVDDTTAHLQSEINRIAAKLNAEPVKVGVQFTSDKVNIFIDDDGRHHYSSASVAARTTTSSATSMTSCTGSPRASPTASAVRTAPATGPNQDLRSLMWAKQYELLTHLDPRWATRAVRETAEKLRAWGYDEDVELLPNIPEHNRPPHPDPQ